MRVLIRAAQAALIILSLAAATARGQIDYRNLDDDRPVRTEDAYPVERYAFEFLAPYAFHREAGGSVVHGFVPEIEHGILYNAQLGVKAPLALRREAGRTERGMSGLVLFALYNFNSETPTLPALSVRSDVTLPVGALAGDHAHVGFKMVATRSWGRNRVHLNGSYTIGPTGQEAALESAARWWLGVAGDRTLYRQSVLVVGELYALKPAPGLALEVNASAGIRWQWRASTVLDVGVSRRLRTTGPDVAATVALSHAFGVPWLMPLR
ncbi:MAG: hypothetical protein HY560_07095 [Gemmatimonadetes bacterium]|nr:hypothetical protein [Gemmatimonadota bacterium]